MGVRAIGGPKSRLPPRCLQLLLNANVRPVEPSGQGAPEADSSATPERRHFIMRAGSLGYSSNRSKTYVYSKRGTAALSAGLARFASGASRRMP
jgi:hypothetical protein